jgi:spermidine synthase
LTALVFISGLAGLIYQVLWVKQLGLLFGNTAQAAAATLAAFFLGLGAGSWCWGRRSSSMQRPLRLVAGLELGIAACALAYFAVLAGIHAGYPAIYGALSGSSWLVGVNFLLSLALVFPASFFMGGTVPAMAQVVVRELNRFGQLSALLYGLNTLGAAAGVLLAAFVLIPQLGQVLSYAFAVGLSLVVAGIAVWLSRGGAPIVHAEAIGARKPSGESAESAAWQSRPNDGAPSVGSSPSPRNRLALGALCFLSGFVLLALEVVWTRIFAQVHENSVYAYAVILAVVLICLAIGAGISALIARKSQHPLAIVGWLVLAGGGLLMLGPELIMLATHQLEPVHSLESWGDHLKRLYRMTFLGIGSIVILLGTVFPLLVKVAERQLQLPGPMLGRLLGINTFGAVAGSLVAGFALLPALGMWGSLKWLSAVYLGMALFLPRGWGLPALGARAGAVTLLALLFTAFDPSQLPVMGHQPGKAPEKVLQVWEEADATVVAVERKDGHRSILINGSYTLGSTKVYWEQANQARIPLYLFPETRSICFVGMGTGMSAGAAFHEDFDSVERVVTCELSPAVVEAARLWIPDQLTGGLFNDPRSEIRIEDGRHYLAATRERFDMINADLFLPYRRGTGSLYSLDYYRIVADSLEADGVFVQWLPLYQLTSQEFGTIARTMLAVFDEVTMWRNNFTPGGEKVALIARKRPGSLPQLPPKDKATMREAIRNFNWWEARPGMVRVEAESMAFFYAGNLAEARGRFDYYPVNTDNHPVIEYQTPKSFRDLAATDDVIWCVGPNLIKWIDLIFKKCPPQSDPLWQGHADSSLHLIRAGRAFHEAMVAKALDKPDDAESAWQAFKDAWRQAAASGQQ